MMMKRLATALLAVILLPALVVAAELKVVISETISVLPPPEASKMVAVRNTTVQDNMVSGELLNLSSHRVRDVELLIRQIWHWNNEFRPGANPQGEERKNIDEWMPISDLGSRDDALAWIENRYRRSL